MVFRRSKLSLLVGVTLMVLLLAGACASASAPAPSSTPSPTPAPTPEEPYSGQDLTFFRGILPNPSEPFFLETHAQELRELGANIICIWPLYKINEDNTVDIFPCEMPATLVQKYYLSQIQEAHQAGFAVMLEPNTELPQELLQPRNADEFMENFLEVSLEWAEIAEAEQVELFSPLNEPNLVLGDDKAKAWTELVLPKVRERYSGDIVAKFADLGPKGNFSGYDYVAFDVYCTRFDATELRACLSQAVKRAQDYVSDFNLQGVFLGEMGAQVEAGGVGVGGLVTEEEQAKIMDIMFNDTWGELKGYFIHWGSEGPFTVKGRPAEKVVRKWYSK